MNAIPTTNNIEPAIVFLVGGKNTKPNTVQINPIVNVILPYISNFGSLNPLIYGNL